MTRTDFPRLIADLEGVRVSRHKLAKLVENRLGRPFQQVQIDRIKTTGRCEHFVGEIIREIHRDLVPVLQIVPCRPAIEMQTA